MKYENGKLTAIDKSGNRVEFDMLVIFRNEETGKDYIVYTDNTRDETGKVRVYASVYNEDPLTRQVSLGEIGTDREWDAVSEALDIAEEMAGKKNPPDGPAS